MTRERCAVSALRVLPLALAALFAAAPPARADAADGAVCLEGAGEAAIAACGRLIADPSLGDWDRVLLLERRARHYRAALVFSAAIADYARALSLAPDKPSLLIGRGEALGEAPSAEVGPDALARAIADFDAALRIRPGDPAALARRAHAKALSGDLDGALADYDAALADPALGAVLAEPGFARHVAENRAFALNARAYERLERGAVADALADAEAAAAALPGEATVLDTLAEAAAASGEIERAVDAYLAAIAAGGAVWERGYRDGLLARGFPTGPAPEDLAAALRACAEVACRPLGGGS